MRQRLKLSAETAHPFREAYDHNNGIQNPVQAGIDPNQRMIDLNAGDHVATIKD